MRRNLLLIVCAVNLLLTACTKSYPPEGNIALPLLSKMRNLITVVNRIVGPVDARDSSAAAGCYYSNRRNCG